MKNLAKGILLGMFMIVISCNKDSDIIGSSVDFSSGLVTDNAAFLGRSEHTSVVFDGKLWLIGGWNDDGSGDANDVWYSEDGETWMEKTTPTSPVFPARVSHTSVVFKGKLWVIGGLVNGVATNDVWYSEDGETWMKKTTPTSPVFPARYRHTSVVHDGKLWVIGGANETGSSSTKNDVWYSEDGETWIEKTTPTSPVFARRSNHTSVVFKGKLWVIGGFSGTTNTTNNVWSSVDGESWELEIENAVFLNRRNAHTSVVFDNRLWIIGGTVGSSVTNDVWSSLDGKNWGLETAAAAFSVRKGHTSVVLDNKLWVIGGVLGSFNKNDVWAFD